MILNYIILVLSLIALFGFSILIKRFIFYSENNCKQINDYDLFLGLIPVFIIAFIFNIFFPLNYLTELFFIVGILIFIYFIKEVELNKKIIQFFGILLTIVFITYNSQTVYDTKLYHLQILNWNSFYKLNFGLSNLEIRFGTNSFWQLVLSIFNNPKYNVQYLYIFNCIPIAVLINQFNSFTLRNVKLSFIYIFCCLNFILLFSIIHSDSNGLILNSLRSPEADTVAMFFLIFSVYFFLKYFESSKYQDYGYCFIFSCLAAITKISHIGTLLLPISIFFLSKSKFNRVLLICSILFLIWLIKSFVLSGCWLFPVSFTCFPNFFWSTPVEEIKLYSNIVSSYPRAHSAKMSFMNFDYTLYSFKWFIPWLKTYFLATSFTIIFLIVSIISIFFIIVRIFLEKKNIFFKKIFYVLTIFYIFNFYVWFNAPEIRFGYGIFISLSCLFFSYGFKSIIDKYELVSKFKYLPLFFLIILVLQNHKNINFLNNVNKINFDNSNIKLHKKVNGINYYKSDANHGFCNDFKMPCIVYPKKINSKKYSGHNFFYRDSK